MSALLQVGRLEAFYGASQILHGIDLSVARGEQVALIGRNGMGKTTLLRSLMGLVNDCRGDIAFAGRDIRRAAPETIARADIALVPEGRGIFGSLSVVVAPGGVLQVRALRSPLLGWLAIQVPAQAVLVVALLVASSNVPALPLPGVFAAFAAACVALLVVLAIRRR